MSRGAWGSTWRAWDAGVDSRNHVDFGFCVCEMEDHPPTDIACFLESLRGHPVTWGGHTEGRRLGLPGIAQLSCWGGRQGGAGVWGMKNLFLLHWEEMVSK